MGCTLPILPPESSSEACWPRVSVMDACITQDDDRYFSGETDDISNLETSVLESPKDVQLWIKLAYKYLTQKERWVGIYLDQLLVKGSTADCLLDPATPLKLLY